MSKMTGPLRIQIPSRAPEIILCEIFLPGGPDVYHTGWMVTEFVPIILDSKRIVASIAINRPNIQVSATLDTTKENPRIVVLLGQVEPFDRKVFEIIRGEEVLAGSTLTVYWKNWKIIKTEWGNRKLSDFSRIS